MTDEERAEEYVIKKHKIDIKHQPIDFCLCVEFSEDIVDFLAGLKAGRKENLDALICEQEHVEILEKENAELKKQLEISEQVASDNPNLFIENCNLKAENAELKEISEMNSLSKVLIQRCKEVGIKDLYHLANYLTIIENQKHQIDELKTLHEGDQRAIEAIMMQWKAETNELKSHCKAVDEVNEKMKCCENCIHKDTTDGCDILAYMKEILSSNSVGSTVCDNWELAE